LPELFGVVDYPTNNEIVGSEMGIEGWALSSNHENELVIEIFVDDKFIIKSNRNDIRLDVAKAYPNIKNSDKSGFYVEVKLEKFEDGIHDLKVVSKTSFNSTTIGHKKFVLKKMEMLPPKRLRELVGIGDFKSTGKEFLNHFIKLCNLNRNERVLEVGCGVGRIAVGLTDYLSPDGHYEGFDVVPKAIKWAKANITSQFPNFNFTLSDVYNKYYNKTGKTSASEYKFPYENESFDFVYLTSVFTHIRPPEFENYLSETSRVLKSNSRCFSTFFLLNNESQKLMTSEKNLFNFKFQYDGFSSISDDVPENAIAFPEEYVFKLFGKNKLKILKPIHYGGWCERTNPLTGQDVIVALKNSI